MTKTVKQNYGIRRMNQNFKIIVNNVCELISLQLRHQMLCTLSVEVRGTVTFRIPHGICDRQLD